MEEMSKSQLLKVAQQDYLEKVDFQNEKLQEVQGGKCPWYNLSCHLGNDGKICTFSHECTGGCNA
ncbi:MULTISPECIES: plantaricin C family lantibiotic [Virgibacillus]|nr:MULTISPECIES: plantaricin C family lantibiotic [Virgibacillus]MED3739340.1 plantaricin C family lantibiotic [Virgibacillus pantothenticus]